MEELEKETKKKEAKTTYKKEKNSKLTKKQWFLIIGIIILMIIAIGTCIFIITRDKEKVEEPVVEDPEPVVEKNSFSLIAFGDALIHNGVYNDANTYQKGSDGYYIYDFTSMFTDVAEIIKPYNLKFYNQETVIGGKNLGLSSYPNFNSPDEIGDDLTAIGFNIVNLASNHTMDVGVTGATYSANYWHSKKDVLAVGSYTSKEQRDNIEIREENGIKYAVLSYTYGTNGVIVPNGYEYLVNVWPVVSDAKFEEYKSQVKKDVESVREKVDVLMVSMHWGTEYQLGTYDSYQTRSAEYLSSLGVDVIIGTHPHVVQPVEYVGDTLVIYSLGNMISAQDTLMKRIGGVAAFTVNKTTVDGETTSVTLDDVKTDLVYTYYNSFQDFKVIPFTKLNDSLLYNYRSIYDTYKAYLNPKNDSRVKVGFIE